MKKIALLTLLLINLSLSFSLPRNQASPAIFSVTKTNSSILFRHTDSTLTAIPCQSVASIVSNADPSKIVSVWVVQQGDYDKIMQFDYSVCGFSSKSDAVDSLTAWAICDTSSGGGGGGGDVTQEVLDDTSSALNGRIDAKQATLISGTNIKTVNSTTLLGSGNIRVQDSFFVALNTTRDSTIFTSVINGVQYRTPIRDSVGGGGGSLSSLTSATATNNIFNTNYKQRWNWNTIAGDTALVIASNSVNATSNLQNLLTVSQSGANGTSTQTTYGAIFSNTKTGTSSTNIAGRFVASGATNNIAIEAESQVRIKNPSTSTRYLSFWSGTTENGRIGNLNGFGALGSDNLDIVNNCGMSIVFRTGTSGNGTERMRIRAGGTLAIGHTGEDYAALDIGGGSFSNAIYVADAKGIVMNGGSILLNGGTFKSNINTNFGTDGSDNMFFQVAGGSKMIIANSNGVSIGASTTPASSAILDVVSTTKGFLPPRMTATQASAISTPAQGLMLFVTNTNGTFTSVGWWGYNGSTWEKLNN